MALRRLNVKYFSKTRKRNLKSCLKYSEIQIYATNKENENQDIYFPIINEKS